MESQATYRNEFPKSTGKKPVLRRQGPSDYADVFGSTITG